MLLKNNIKIESNYRNTPVVSLIISAYNEERIIEKKIKNSLQLDYPKEKIEIIVVSDASDDNTDQIVEKYEKEGVILIRYEGRIGKTDCLNRTIAKINNDIIIFSDANSMFNKDVVKEIVKGFSDVKVGAVTGFTKYITNRDYTKNSISVYAKIEHLIKKYESKIGSCVGADGAIFAIRKELFVKLKKEDINDFVIPLNIIRSGYKVILNEKVICFEESSNCIFIEYRRQIRIANRSIRAIINNIDLMNPIKYKFFSFQLFSHKFLKYTIPFLIIIIFIANFLLIQQNLFYQISFGIQIILALLTIYGIIYEDISKKSRYINSIVSFFLFNYAIFLAWVTILNKEKFNSWKTTR